MVIASPSTDPSGPVSALLKINATVPPPNVPARLHVPVAPGAGVPATDDVAPARRTSGAGGAGIVEFAPRSRTLRGYADAASASAGYASVEPPPGRTAAQFAAELAEAFARYSVARAGGGALA
jgi:hypothetical protein